MKNRLVVLLVLCVSLVAACDYVGSGNTYGLGPDDFLLIANAESRTSSQVTFTGDIVIETVDGASPPIRLAGEGVMLQDENAAYPDADLQVQYTYDDGTGLRVLYQELRLIGGTLYQRVTADPNDTTTSWVQASFTDILPTGLVSIPIPDQVLPADTQQVLNAVYTTGPENFTTITREPGTVPIDGEETARFQVVLDVDALVADPGFQQLLNSDPLTNMTTLSPQELAQKAQLLQDTFSGVEFEIDQYVGLGSGQLVHSTTQIVVPISFSNVPTQDPITIHFYLDTHYRFDGQTVSIEAPEDIAPEMIPDGESTIMPEIAVGPQLSDIQASVDPESMALGGMCSQVCTTRQFSLNFPEIVNPKTETDVVFVIDVTESMDDEIGVMQNTISTMAAELQTEDPSIRFALVSFGDFETMGSGRPYELLSDFTSNAQEIAAATENIETITGGTDWQESILLPLMRVAAFNWRPNAHRIVILITDSYPRDQDPGENGELGDADDLTPDQVIDHLVAQGVVVLSLQSDSNGSSRQFLQDIADRTDGFYRRLSEASDLPDYVVELVELATGGTIDLVPVAANFRSSTDNDWLTFDVSSFDYPTSGGAVPVTVEICPNRIENLPDGDYNFQIDLRGARQSFGRLPVSFTYDVLCADVYIPDDNMDDGSRCTDVGGAVYWDSPAIIVRQAADHGSQTEFPRPNAENYVYVQIANQGPQEATSVLVELWASEAPFNETAETGWTFIGSQQIARLGVGEQVMTEPFRWVPTTEHITLQAVVTTAEDNVFQDRNDVACENNIAQLSRIPMVLDTPSYGKNLMGGSRSFTLSASLIYDVLDLVIRMDELPGEGSFIAVDLDHNTFDAWSAAGSPSQDGAVLPSGRVTSRPGADQLILENLVAGGAAQVDMNMLVVASSLQAGRLPVGLQASDRVITGSTIYYTVDQDILPSQPAEPLDDPLEIDDRRSPFSTRIPYLLTAILLVFCVVAWFMRRPRRKRDME